MTIKIENRVNRVTGYLNDLLRESFAEKAEKYEVISQEVDKYMVCGIGPHKVSLRDKPTYEFYLKPSDNEEPRVRVMILHKPDLNARIVGGIKNERKHYCVNHFKGNLEKAINELES